MPTNTIRLVLANGDRLVRECLAAVLSRHPQIGGVHLCDGRDVLALLTYVRAENPDIVVVDVQSGPSRRFEAVWQLRAVAPDLRVLVTGLPNRDSDILEAVEAGAAGYATTESSVEDLIANVLALSIGQTICSPRVASLVFSRLAHEPVAPSRPSELPHEPQLTRRELQIVELIEIGMSNKEIARRLSLGVQTVKNHVHNVLEKLHVQRRIEAARFARARGLLTRADSTSP